MEDKDKKIESLHLKLIPYFEKYGILLLLEPDNEEAMYMLIDIKLEKSDIEKVKDLMKKFEVICENLCSKMVSINERLNNIDVKNES